MSRREVEGMMYPVPSDSFPAILYSLTAPPLTRPQKLPTNLPPESIMSSSKDGAERHGGSGPLGRPAASSAALPAAALPRCRGRGGERLQDGCP